MLSAGSKVPSFSVYDTDKQVVNNASIKGQRTLFLFFPAAFTGTCTRELCSVRDDISRYNDLDVKVYGISTDMVYTLIKYKEEQGLNFSLLSDYNKEMIKAFDTEYETFNFGMKGVAKRSAFIIDSDETIQYVEILENASEVPDFNAILEVLKKLASAVK